MVPFYIRRDALPPGEFGQKEYNDIRRIVYSPLDWLIDSIKAEATIPLMMPTTNASREIDPTQH